MKHTISTFRTNCALILIVLITAGCADTEPYHTIDWTQNNCDDPTAEACIRSYYQEHPDYDLAFAEFTERGNAFNSEWIDKMLGNIRSRADEQGVVLVAFVHGWKHNADEGDRNLADFKKSLTSLAGSTSLHGRRLVGLYVGWRGASLDLPWVENLTFWERKAVAEEVGKGGVTRLLLELDRIDRGRASNVLVVVGHSFGGAIVVSAATEVLVERVIDGATSARHRPTIGDAVIVLNPAIEANQSLILVETAIKEKYPQGQSPLFVSISSNADSATHYAFPLGQTVGLLLTWHQLDLQRPYYKDRQSGEMLDLKEEHLDSTTVGNFAPYLTHWLTADSTGERPRLDLQTCDKTPEQCVPKGLTTLSGHPMIDPLPEGYPLYFVKTDETVMNGHNDIFNSVIRTFMLTLIDDVVRQSIAFDAGDVMARRIEPVPGSILSNPVELNRRFQNLYPTE